MRFYVCRWLFGTSCSCWTLCIWSKWTSFTMRLSPWRSDSISVNGLRVMTGEISFNFIFHLMQWVAANRHIFDTLLLFAGNPSQVMYPWPPCASMSSSTNWMSTTAVSTWETTSSYSIIYAKLSGTYRCKLFYMVFPYIQYTFI